jgi:pyruvate dehydrogenase complex dehydrogenase (E1) component
MKQQRTTISTSLRTHQYDTKYQDHIEKADSLNFPTVLMGLGVADRVFVTKYYSLSDCGRKFT